MGKQLPPLFITLDGIDGTGKTTLAYHLDEKLTQYGYKVNRVPMLGSGKLGSILRDKILNTNSLTASEETLYMATSIIETMRETVPKLLKENNAVILDRYLSSFYAYQFRSKDDPLAGTIYANLLKEGYFDIIPDWFIFTSCEPQIAEDRINKRQNLINQNNNFDLFDENRKALIRKYMAHYFQRSIVPKRTLFNTDDTLTKCKQRMTRQVKNFLNTFWSNPDDVGG